MTFKIINVKLSHKKYFLFTKYRGDNNRADYLRVNTRFLEKGSAIGKSSNDNIQ